MRTAFSLLVILLTVLASGCMTAVPEVPPAQTMAVAIPNLTGTWTGPMQGYDEGVGFTDYSDLIVVMTVSEQHGRLFSGNFVFSANNTETTTGFAGVIGRDNRTFAIAEKAGGYCSGEVIASDEIEMIYMEDGSPYSIAIDSFRRV